MKFDLLLSRGRKRMFIWNNIFFSFAFDSRDHFQELGGKLSLWYFCFYDVKIGFGAKTPFWCFLFFFLFFSGDEAAYSAAVRLRLFALLCQPENRFWIQYLVPSPSNFAFQVNINNNDNPNLKITSVLSLSCWTLWKRHLNSIGHFGCVFLDMQVS